MEIKEIELKDAFVINLKPLEDERGIFTRFFCKKELELDSEIVQVNHSFTKNKGTIRGMHFQLSPKSEIKVIRCIRGKVYDVIVDIRKDSPTFLQHHVEILSADENKMIFVPRGFAHGFQTLEDDSELMYFHSEYYSPKFESGILYHDSLINIEWPLEVTLISERDNSYKELEQDFRGIEL